MEAPRNQLMLALVLGHWFHACEPSASSPPEAQPRPSSEISDAGTETCVAASFPILFHSVRPPLVNLSHVYVMRADGSGAQPITAGRSQLHSSAWSPDGHSVAYRRVDDTDVERDQPGDVGLLDPDEKVRVTLVQDLSPAVSPVVSEFPPDGPTWSPDGRSIAYASRDGSGQWAVWVMSRSGGQHHVLMPDLDVAHFGPSWAPHSPHKLAYVSEINGVADVWLVNPLEPSERSPLTSDVDRALFRAPKYLRWSPDERFLAFSAEDPAPARGGGGDQEVYLIDVDARTLRKFTDNGADDVTPTWSPDGKSLLLASNRALSGSPEVAGTSFDLWQVPLDPREPSVALTHGEGSNAAPDWFELPACVDAAP